ncbi:LysM peptidoglycan-binding domain-containing protein [Dysgonomonas sp. 25]|uniref:LysM peptidoglycan-binding domain-containing protein n=1 Tax=Dysgonomonas sp. 25 TaxID=2302933 RepID=UPI0013D031F1|nr:LysM peptidoglycan-binding domain-containing protein [Dysgonomonas sp. 25]NDV70231.1 LysM peptidoglycan-binding domain-containing protein [Dysgonomonas sp. 25]
MKLKNICLLLLIMVASCNLAAKGNTAPVTAINESAITHDDYINHTVVSGETVFSLARKYKTTVEEIYRLNPEARDGIKGGQVLKIPKQKATSDTSYFEYTVQKGETLYRITKNNEVTVETLYSLNPQLKEEGLKEGMILKIPRLKIAPDNYIPEIRQQDRIRIDFSEHTVEAGETLYKLSKQYNIAIEDIIAANPDVKNGLKAGMLLRIPNNAPVTAILPDTRFQGTPVKAGETIRVAILLPFTEGGKNVRKEKLVEYYEGFLLAVRELKATGLNAEIYTFDTGSENDTQRLISILETSEMRGLHLLIGGISQVQIDIMSDFSRRTGTRYVIPFGTSRDKDVLAGSPNTYQMTVSHKTLFAEITKAFADKFRNENIIFVTEPGSNLDKRDFTDVLKAVLASEGIPYKDLHTQDNMVEEIKSATVLDKNNILIPTSSSEPTLRRLSGILNTVIEPPKKQAGKESEPQAQITLFGYPDWQAYLNLTSQLYKFNTYIYTGFYLDESNKTVQREMYEYKKWYNKEIPLSFPKFCFLGYDTGVYFLSGLQKYNNSFDSHLSTYSAPTLQSAIRFERAGENSGYINSGFYFVHYVTDVSVEKTEFK